MVTPQNLDSALGLSFGPPDPGASNPISANDAGAPVNPHGPGDSYDLSESAQSGSGESPVSASGSQTPPESGSGESEFVTLAGVKIRKNALPAEQIEFLNQRYEWSEQQRRIHQGERDKTTKRVADLEARLEALTMAKLQGGGRGDDDILPDDEEGLAEEFESLSEAATPKRKPGRPPKKSAYEKQLEERLANLERRLTANDSPVARVEHRQRMEDDAAVIMAELQVSGIPNEQFEFVDPVQGMKRTTSVAQRALEWAVGYQYDQREKGVTEDIIMSDMGRDAARRFGLSRALAELQKHGVARRPEAPRQPSRLPGDNLGVASEGPRAGQLRQTGPQRPFNLDSALGLKPVR